MGCSHLVNTNPRSLALLLVLLLAAASAAAFVFDSHQPPAALAPRPEIQTAAAPPPTLPALNPPRAAQPQPQPKASSVAASVAAVQVDLIGLLERPVPASTPLASSEPPLPRAVIRVTPGAIRQGEAVGVLVDAEWAAKASLRLGDERTPMLRIEPSWFAVAPFARDHAIGAQRLTVDLYDEAGELQRSVHAIVSVAALEVATEHINLAGANFVPAGTVPTDHDDGVPDLRFDIHTSVSGPPLWQGPWQRPVEGTDTGWFGAQRVYNGQLGRGWHHGHDIGAPWGTPIRAPAAGRVVWAGSKPTHGIGVILDHGAGVYSGYWHLAYTSVEVGDDLALGGQLGVIGLTGLTTGAHLHWEVIVRGHDIDPLQWLGPNRPRLPGESASGR